MWIPPFGSTVTFRPAYTPMSRDNTRADTRCVRDNFICQRRRNRMKIPSLSRFDAIKVAGGAIFTGFYPNGLKLSGGEKQSIFDERKQLNIKVGGKRKYFNKKNIAGLFPSSPKINWLRRSSTTFHLWNPSVRNLEKVWEQVRKQINTRTMWAAILVAPKSRIIKRGLTESLCASCYIW